MGLWWSRFEW